MSTPSTSAARLQRGVMRPSKEIEGPLTCHYHCLYVGHTPGRGTLGSRKISLKDCVEGNWTGSWRITILGLKLWSRTNLNMDNGREMTVTNLKKTLRNHGTGYSDRDTDDAS